MATADDTEQPTHETIHILCTIGGRNYLACGFLKDGELLVNGQTMLDRVGKIKDTVPIDDEEWNHLLKNLQDFKKFPELDLYYLATERHHPDFPQSLSSLIGGRLERCENSSPVEDHWFDYYLVLRRCISNDPSAPL